MDPRGEGRRRRGRGEEEDPWAPRARFQVDLRRRTSPPRAPVLPRAAASCLAAPPHGALCPPPDSAWLAMDLAALRSPRPRLHL
ncbi:hypothetical protein ZWY2020_035006 [Hordeum vulgare]|nr:hypothetical protein ZWY2020_035006 [Hordeum vulgare]